MVEEARARLGDVGAFQLEPFFGEIEVEWYPDSLEISEVEPLAAYVRSLGAADDADVLATAEAAIARTGSSHATKFVGLFLCRKR
jgi:hypothetical protein